MPHYGADKNDLILLIPPDSMIDVIQQTFLLDLNSQSPVGFDSIFSSAFNLVSQPFKFYLPITFFLLRMA